MEPKVDPKVAEETDDEDQGDGENEQNNVEIRLDLENEPSPPPIDPAFAVDPQSLLPAATFPKPSDVSLHMNAATQSQTSKLLRRDSAGRLRLIDKEGGERPVDLAKRFLANMDIETSQLSALSPTQENSSSAYEHLDIQQFAPLPSSDRSQEDANDTGGHTQRQQYSTKTDSTAHTYKDNDTGHIDLTLGLEASEEHSDEEPESQDASFAVPNTGLPTHGHPLPPETPAPPINPFPHKGSVLKGHEMFAATQPSVGRNIASPTSSRPSPNIYDDFTSPARSAQPSSNRMLSSPLAQRKNHRADEPILPQSSIPNPLSQSLPTKPQHSSNARKPGAKSFDSNPLRPVNSSPEPRQYHSMKESEERRKRQSRADYDSGSETESDDEFISRQRKLQMEKKIQEELSAVNMPSSRARSSSARMEETENSAPQTSTGRRRSIQDDYTAQTFGTDARDTQQDDEAKATQQEEDLTQQDDFAVPDSQSALKQDAERLPSLRKRSPVPEANFEVLPAVLPNAPVKPPSLESTQNDSERVPATETELAEQDITETIESSKDEPSHSLPLQEVSSNRMDLRTPAASKAYQERRSNEPEEIVPESSPSHSNLRPMGDIGLSFEGDDEGDKAVQDLLDNPPGFTQDAEFFTAIDDPLPSLPSGPSLRKEASNPSRNANPEPSVTVTVESTSPVVDAAEDTPKSVLQLVAEAGKESNPDEIPLVPTKPAEKDNVELRAEDHAEEIEARRETPHSLTARPPSEPSTEPSTEPNAGEPSVPSKTIKLPEVADVDDTSSHAPNALDLPVAKRGLRTKKELKGPSQALRRSTNPVTSPYLTTPRQPSRVTKYSKKRSIVAELPPEFDNTKVSKDLSSVSNSASATPRSTPRAAKTGSDSLSSTTRSSRRQAAANQTVQTPQSPVSTLSKRNVKRKTGAIAIEDGEQATVPSRSSKRQSTGRVLREDSSDPLDIASNVNIGLPLGKKSVQGKGLFTGMCFAVSYNHEEKKNAVMKAISENGGQILTNGFDGLFETTSKEDETSLSITSAAENTGFLALIADEHSRKPKYLQALALGLPCLQGRWITACLSKGSFLDWKSYLLCAGQSTARDDATISRSLEPPYTADEATLESTFADRIKSLKGKSVLLVVGKNKTDERRKTFMFLTRALGPDRVGQVVDFAEARSKLLEAQGDGHEWDLLYVDSKDKAAEKAAEKAAQTAVFGASPEGSSGGGSRKRKRGPTAVDETPAPPPKKIRIITDEVVIQSLIVGELIEE